jgi:hypothetical protein
VVHAGDAHCGDGTALKGADQHAAQGVAKGGGLAAIEGPIRNTPVCERSSSTWCSIRSIW